MADEVKEARWIACVQGLDDHLQSRTPFAAQHDAQLVVEHARACGLRAWVETAEGDQKP